jgi:hypothetical protein
MSAGYFHGGVIPCNTSGGDATTEARTIDTPGIGDLSPAVAQVQDGRTACCQVEMPCLAHHNWPWENSSPLRALQPIP